VSIAKISLFDGEGHEKEWEGFFSLIMQNINDIPDSETFVI